MTRTALLALAFLIASPAAAGPGDYKEDELRAQVEGTVEFRCPPGTKRTVTEEKGNMVETCVTSQGVMNGYFLKWAADGSTWLQLGSYSGGEKDGKWIKFTKDGKAKRVSWYKNGVKTRKPARAR